MYSLCLSKKVRKNIGNTVIMQINSLTISLKDTFSIL